MKIVLDAMGSDEHPAPDVEGAVLAAREYKETIILVGDEARIKAELVKHKTDGLSIEVVHASQAVAMTDKPGTVGRGKPDSSMHVGMRLVKEGGADAFVTMGNTGAALAIATLHVLRRISGVYRPALSAILRLQERSMILLDIGANADCKPEWMAQFALMGSLYAEHALKNNKPRVGLLSNGEEAGKGSALVQETAELLLTGGVNFIGNVEPKEVLKGGVDVAVMDGFSGNVMLKTMEAFGSALFGLIRQELMADSRSKLAGLLAKPAFRRVYRQVDPFEIGGAPLLGVDGVVIIGHGRSNGIAVKNAIRQARNAVNGRIVPAIRQGLSTNAQAAVADGFGEQG
ncbi:MAG: phosphate acyltransferase PlsX [Chloroflexi bacterium]|nr:phosphate acyltransferase PlsX [Chloroflexota bacterium]